MPVTPTRRNVLQVVKVPIQGLNYSVPPTGLSEKNSFAKNCRILQGEVLQRYGHADFGTAAMADIPIHLAQYIKADLTQKIVRVSSDETEVYNSSTTAWDEITKDSDTSATEWTGTEGTNFFDHCVFDDQLLLTNGVDDIQAYAGGAGICADLSGSPPKAKYIESFSDYVILGHVIDGGTTYPTRLQWCDTGDETDWTNGNAGSVDLKDEPDEITGIKNLNDYMAIYKSSHIYMARLINTVDVFQVTHVVSGIGLLNNRCVVNFNGLHYFLGSDGNIYAFNGVRVESIGNEVRDQIFPRWNTDRIETMFARLNLRTREIEFYITLMGNDWPTEVYKVNYENGTIHMDEVDSVTCAALYQDTTTSDETWDSDSGSWDDDVTRWDEGIGGTKFDFTLIGKSDKGTYKELPNSLSDDGEAIDQTFITADFSLGTDEYYKRWYRLSFIAKGNELTLSYSTDHGVTFTDIPKNSSTTAFALTDEYANYHGWFDVKAQYIRFRFRNNTTGEYFRLREFSIEAKVGENIYK